MSGQELVIAARHRLSRSAKLLSFDPLSTGGPVLSPGADVTYDPLGCCATPSLGGDSGHKRQAGLLPVLVGNGVVGVPPRRCRPGELVRLLVALDPLVCRHPADRIVTLLSLALMRVQASMLVTAKRCPGPRTSDRTLSMAGVESTNTMY